MKNKNYYKIYYKLKGFPKNFIFTVKLAATCIDDALLIMSKKYLKTKFIITNIIKEN